MQQISAHGSVRFYAAPAQSSRLIAIAHRCDARFGAADRLVEYAREISTTKPRRTRQHENDRTINAQTAVVPFVVSHDEARKAFRDQ
jgi:hypothetical protein